MATFFAYQFALLFVGATLPKKSSGGTAWVSTSWIP
jgi:hypothetical protein